MAELPTTSSSTGAFPKHTAAASQQREPLPEPNRGLLSRVFFLWVFALVRRGRQHALHDADLWELRGDERAAVTAAALHTQWTLAVTRGACHPLWTTLLRANARALRALVALRLADLVFSAVQPILLGRLLASLQSRRPSAELIAWASALCAAAFLRTLFENHYYFLAIRVGMRVRSALQALLYRKSLTISPSARATASLGELVNLMQLDTKRVSEFFEFSHVLWSAPPLVVVCVALLYMVLGPSAVIGLLGAFVMLPLQAKLFATMARRRETVLSFTDRRVKLMNEILHGIRAVKSYAWEPPFAAAVANEREHEVRNISSIILLQSANLAFVTATPLIIAVVTFAFYSAVFKNQLVPSNVFTGIGLLNILRVPVLVIPVAISSAIDARLGVKRIQRFLFLEDTENYSRCEQVVEQLPESSTYVSSSDIPVVGANLTNNGSPDFVDSLSRDDIAAVHISHGEFIWARIASNPRTAEKKEKGCGFGWRIRKRNAIFTTPPNGTTAVDDSVNSVGRERRNEEPASVEEVKSHLQDHASGAGLRNINVSFSPGQLVGVVGRVGSGKSSLLHAILGEMRKVSGDVRLRGSVAYVAQTPWIFNDTLRNNVIFGKPYSEELYKRAIHVSELGHDIAILPGGDLTEIGERGINLSGGQKQRVSIARAVYQKADVYLFDDPLSALDTNVSRHVFEKCMSPRGALKDKLRLLVTNQTHVLPECDMILHLHDGTVRNQGRYDELASDPAFAALIADTRICQNSEEEPSGTAFDQKRFELGDAVESENTTTGHAGRSLIQEEERHFGKMSWRIVLHYISSWGPLLMSMSLIAFWVTVSILGLLAQWWLAYWSEQETLTNERDIQESRPVTFYIGIFVALTSWFTFFTFLGSLWFNNAALSASKKIHNEMLSVILHAPMTFFDRTPIGRILSRFSHDIFILDELLPEQFEEMTTYCMRLVTSYAFIGVLFPWFLAAAIPVIGFYVALQRFYSPTSLELKRLDSISKSPIYAHFSETLSGLSTIRAFSRQSDFVKENMEKIDINQRAYFMWVVTNRWFSVYLEISSTFLVFFSALVGVIARDIVHAGTVGLAVTLAIQVSEVLGYTVRTVTDVEAQMSAVERVRFYTRDLPQEAANVVDLGPGSDWPADGNIEITNVEMKYRDGLPLVLKGVNMSVKGGEKVGIVGRTGSGKSSLVTALLRMVELSGGRICVDGVNLRTIGLHDVRKRVTIIPQDPVIFSGTVRFNLDPFDEHGDAALWDALDKSHMKHFVSKLDHGLDSKVSEYGENMSAGQRQVICLTRALLRASKILILDEATSSLDTETDRLMQEAIRTHLKDTTILTIAHRLSTLADYDKIVVLNDGVVAECGTPEELTELGGTFASLVEAMGPEGAAGFRSLVAGSP